MPVLAAHPRRGRDHPHRVPGPPHLYPRRPLRRVGPAPRAAPGGPGHRACRRHLQRPGLCGQPARHPPQRPRPDPAGSRHPASRAADHHFPRHPVAGSRLPECRLGWLRGIDGRSSADQSGQVTVTGPFRGRTACGRGRASTRKRCQSHSRRRRRSPRARQGRLPGYRAHPGPGRDRLGGPSPVTGDPHDLQANGAQPRHDIGCVVAADVATPNTPNTVPS